jgi:CheY-like chemotaxis protein
MIKYAKPIHVLLADDDKDDRFFFKKALGEINLPTHFKSVHDGEQLMKHLYLHSNHLPDILFLDLNMPRKNGSECLSEIKTDRKLAHLPVVIYSTSLNEEIADILYEKGAHYYIRKHDFPELKKLLYHFLNLFSERKFKRPSRDKFIFCPVAA